MSADVTGKILALGCACIWAVAVIFFKRSGETIPPLGLNLFKSTVAAIVMLPLWYILDSPMIPESLSLKDMGALALSGIAGITVADTLFFICLNKLGAGYYAIIDCAYSPSMMFFSWVLMGESLTPFHFWGAGLVISGVLIVTSERNFQKNLGWKKILSGGVAGISAIILMVVSIIGVKPILDTHSAIMVAQCRLIPAVIVLHIVCLTHAKRATIYRSVVASRAFRLALPGALLGNVLSMLAWIAAFKYTDMGSASILNQTSVIFVAVFARLFLREELTYRRMLATALGFAGAVIVLRGCGS